MCMILLFCTLEIIEKDAKSKEYIAYNFKLLYNLGRILFEGEEYVFSGRCRWNND